MNTTATRPIRTRPTKPRLEPIWIRAEPSPVSFTPSLIATHDFLVPNPRPDLIFDRHTLRMIEVR